MSRMAGSPRLTMAMRENMAGVHCSYECDDEVAAGCRTDIVVVRSAGRYGRSPGLCRNAGGLTSRTGIFPPTVARVTWSCYSPKAMRTSSEVGATAGSATAAAVGSRWTSGAITAGSISSTA